MRTDDVSLDSQVEKFNQLQNKLRQYWQGKDLFEQDGYDILVIPSFSMDQKVGQKVSGFLHYEERLLFSLIRLRNPKTRLIYVTAQPLSPIIIEYYLQLLPGIPFSHARDRLLLLTTYDNSFKPLTQKILERPRLLERIRRALRPDKSYMVCFNATKLEQELSLSLEVPLFAASPQLNYWGSKSGSREIFTECSIPHPDGSPLVKTVDDLVLQTNQLWERQPNLQRVVVKLNEGFSGEGNAVLNLNHLKEFAPNKGYKLDRIAAINNNLKNLSFQAKDETWSNFSSRIPELGAIVEAFIEGEEKRSPSVQGYITPKGEVKILSTHDQILGGPDGQIYLGCRFPADQGYRLQLQALGLKIGQALAKRGAMERYGVDFLAVRKLTNKGEEWEIEAIEINLRKGGTTHPFMTLKLLTNGSYDESTGLFYTQQDQEKYYIASDNLQKPQYAGLLPDDLMDIIAKHHLHFDSSTKTGTLFHLMGALSEFGKLGLTCIGNSLAEAEAIYQQVEDVLDKETGIMNDGSGELIAPNIPIIWTL
ncbi:peptide ligase PGM1-related protein [Crocosphaera sp. XPORK-15E]|uniref:peptide ligase PGM1-related protein n=1 Tax=Crocosphaera sp. XPORK-15E TaxID=3110247 RepID=UPI002B21C605|nr:peptide ligase PGM1-related protein [Crocosphaera sp. XPORK-15E]MEA5534253.1 peptide ligase PGM1-related protein [Crocosphaera sp. XPORK-15E]